MVINEKRAMGRIVKCATCGHEFEYGKNGHTKFCSNFCETEGKYYFDSLKPKRNHMYEKRESDSMGDKEQFAVGLPITTCVVCGKTMLENIGKGNKRKYCSGRCKAKARSDYQKEYFRKRWTEDSEFRRARYLQSSKYQKEKRSTEYERTLEYLAKRFARMNSEEDILQELIANVRSIKRQ